MGASWGRHVTEFSGSPSDVVIVESGKVDGVPDRKKFGRMKLLQFSENHRPAYWGTWNKKTTVIHPRDPWARDKVSTWQTGRWSRHTGPCFLLVAFFTLVSWIPRIL